MSDSLEPVGPMAPSEASAVANTVAQRGLMGAVRFYRYFLAPWLGSRCRYDPTCSRYALDALQLHGAGVGTALAMARVLRCHPWCRGGHDPVPAPGPHLFTRLFQRPAELPAERAPDPAVPTSTSP